MNSDRRTIGYTTPDGVRHIEIVSRALADYLLAQGIATNPIIRTQEG